MDYFISIVKQLFYITIISKIFISIMPSEKHQKNIKMICGLIIILIIIQPLFKIGNIGEKFESIYKKIVYDNQLDEIRSQTIISEENSVTVIKNCEEDIGKNIEKIVLDTGLYPKSTYVKIDDNSQSVNYGRIVLINCVVSKEINKDKDSQNIVSIEKININLNNRNKTSKTDKDTEIILEKIAKFYDISKDLVHVTY